MKKEIATHSLPGCPGQKAANFEQCVRDCQACRPRLPARVQEILELSFLSDPGYVTITGGVLG